MFNLILILLLASICTASQCGVDNSQRPPTCSTGDDIMMLPRIVDMFIVQEIESTPANDDDPLAAELVFVVHFKYASSRVTAAHGGANAPGEDAYLTPVRAIPIAADEDNYGLVLPRKYVTPTRELNVLWAICTDIPDYILGNALFMVTLPLSSVLTPASSTIGVPLTLVSGMFIPYVIHGSFSRDTLLQSLYLHVHFAVTNSSVFDFQTGHGLTFMSLQSAPGILDLASVILRVEPPSEYHTSFLSWRVRLSKHVPLVDEMRFSLRLDLADIWSYY